MHIGVRDISMEPQLAFMQVRPMNLRSQTLLKKRAWIYVYTVRYLNNGIEEIIVIVYISTSLDLGFYLYQIYRQSTNCNSLQIYFH